MFNSLPENADVTVVVNGSHPKTTEWLLTQTHPRLNWYEVSTETLSAARNRAFLTCGGDIIYYLDDDVLVPEGVFQNVLEVFRKNPELAVLGGPNFTPPGSPKKEVFFGAILTSAFAAPKVRARYGSLDRERPAGENELIFCNLAVRKQLIPAKIRFFESFTANQENYFLYQLRNCGLKIQFSPSIFVYHRRRTTFRKFFEQIYSYGKGRAQQSWQSFESSNPLFYLPALLWLALGFLAVYSIPVLVTVFVFYLLVGSISSLFSKQMRSLSWWGFIQAGWVTFGIHLSYGLGFWTSLFRLLQESRNMAPPVIKSLKTSKST